ncbi:hypothetical protein [[Actinomadura] parvosata]|uniref:hypothetical protein n=1 Tax=[Actinomadura] parvosata TaxID=1955412 RepID=UPI001E490BCA|nr:hypothetical protein [Nonomuraea sp. ATCC 55076]
MLTALMVMSSGFVTSATAASATALASVISCPAVADRLGQVPARAEAEVQRNLQQLETQLAEANRRLANSAGQGGPNFVQNAILGPLKDKRAATLQRIAIAFQRAGAEAPSGLQNLATCAVEDDGNDAGDGDQENGGQENGGQENGGQDTGNQGDNGQQTGDQGQNNGDQGDGDQGDQGQGDGGQNNNGAPARSTAPPWRTGSGRCPLAPRQRCNATFSSWRPSSPRPTAAWRTRPAKAAPTSSRTPSSAR